MESTCMTCAAFDQGIETAQALTAEHIFGFEDYLLLNLLSIVRNGARDHLLRAHGLETDD